MITTRIFCDLAEIANYAFQYTKCEEGVYDINKVASNKNGEFNIELASVDIAALPECATWKNTDLWEVQLSYDGGNYKYSFDLQGVFSLLLYFRKMEDNLTGKIKDYMCQMVKTPKIEGELCAVFNLPKNLTKQLVKCCAKDTLRPAMNGMYIDEEGYAVCTDGKVMNVANIKGDFKEYFKGAILPRDFASRAEGCEVKIYKSFNRLKAICGDMSADCIDERFPKWKMIVERYFYGRIKLSLKDIQRSMKKDFAILSFEHGATTMSQIDESNNISNKCLLPSEHNIDKFNIIISRDMIKKAIPGCKELYVIDSKNYMCFVGEECLSIVMNINKVGDYSFSDIINRTVDDKYSLYPFSKCAA